MLFAQFGTPDLTFGTNGRVDHDFGTNYLVPTYCLEQTDGKILVAGASNFQPDKFVVTRFLENGEIDITYGTNGRAILYALNSTGPNIRKILLQPNGKLLLAGEYGLNGLSQVSIFRLNENGTLDNSFGVYGIYSYNLPNNLSDLPGLADFTLQLDNKIIVSYFAGAGFPFITRLNTNGIVDTSYGTNGIFRPFINTNLLVCKVAVQQDGKFLFIAYDLNQTKIVRYNQDNTLDTNYGTNGYNVIPVNNPDYLLFLLQPDSKCLLQNSSGGKIYRFNIDGNYDNTFGNNGQITFNILNNYFGTIKVLSQQQDGKILLSGVRNVGSSGGVSTNAMRRFNANGSVDTTFGNNGLVLIRNNDQYKYAGPVLSLHSGKILFMAQYYYGALNPSDPNKIFTGLDRFNSGLVLGNEGFSESKNIAIYPNPTKNTLTITFTANIKEISIYNTLGQLLQNFTKPSKSIDVSNLQSGNYFMKIVTENGVSSQRFVKE